MTTSAPERRAGDARRREGAGGTPRRDGPGDALEAPGFAAERGTLALWLGLLGIAGLAAALAFVPGMWGWGLDLLRFVPRGSGWAIWAAGTLLLIPALARPAARALDRAEASALARRALALLWVAGAGLLAWCLPDRVAFTGDFLLRQGAAMQALPSAKLFPQALPLDVLLHYHLPRLLIGAGWASADQASRALGALEAAGLAGLALAFARALDLRGAAAFAASSLALFGGWLGLFTGYGKAFSELVVLAVAIAVCALRAHRTGAGLAPLGLALASSLALHRSALAFLPAGALALAAGVRARGAHAWREPGVLVGVGAPILTLLVLGPRLAGTLAGFDLAHHLASAEVMREGGVWGAAVAPFHLLELVNLVALLAPVALVLPALALAAGLGLGRGPEALPLLALAAPQLVLMLFVHPSQGVFRDWDVFAAAGLSLALLAALAVGRLLSAAPPWRWLGVSVAAAAAAQATLWLVHSADLDRGLERVTAFATESPLRSEIERGTTWEFIGTCANQRGRTELAAEAMAHAAALTPSVRVLMEWGMAEETRGNLPQARLAFELAAARDSTQPRLWMNVLNVSLQLGDLAGARRAAEKLRPLMPGSDLPAKAIAAIERREAEDGRKAR